jgi:hypothetical protein
MKTMFFSALIVLLLCSFSPADRLSLGAGYYVGAASYASLGSLVGGYVQYQLTDWLAGRVCAGSISANQHIENKKTTTSSDEPGTLSENQSIDITNNTFPYLSAHLLATVSLGKGQFYVGPGVFTATLKGSGKLSYHANFVSPDDSWYFNYDQDLEVKKQTLTGITMTMGGSIDVTDVFFIYGESMLLGSYQTEYEYSWDNITTGSDYDFPYNTHKEETGKYNFGLAAMGFGVGVKL